MLAQFSNFAQHIPFSKFPQGHIDRIKRNLVDEYKSQLVKGGEIAEVMEKLESGLININDYYSEMVKIQGKKSIEALNEYN